MPLTTCGSMSPNIFIYLIAFIVYYMVVGFNFGLIVTHNLKKYTIVMLALLSMPYVVVTDNVKSGIKPKDMSKKKSECYFYKTV